MSGFEKNGIHSMNSYGTLSEYNVGGHGTVGSSGLYPSATLLETPKTASSDQVTYGNGSSFYQSRAGYDSPRSSFEDYPALRKAPEVKEYNPTRGSQGTPVYVFLRADYDLQTVPGLIVSLMFASRRIPATLARLESQGPAFEYCVTADAPNFAETESSSMQIQLRLHLQEQSGQLTGLTDVIDVGYFHYTSSTAATAQDNSRKRKLSIDSGDMSRQYSGDYLYGSTNGMGYSRGLQSTDIYGRTQQRYRDLNPRRPTHDFSRSPDSRSLMHPPGSQRSMYNPSALISNSTGRSLTLDGSLSSGQANPPLIRTSTIQPSGSGSTASAAAAFNPYAMYPQKAVLKLRGNLNTMTDNWTPDEWTAKRRLVQFWRTQNKSTINAEFAPVKPEDRLPNSICISCIWWEERGECFATSVDTIYLLEQLVALRFTVEEKNRIRRNLEGFKPLTVAKGKADSEEFFKVIMGFPTPKPRNIEKDVKVFEWKILGSALKKIMSKYSASYSSTAGVLPQARNTMFPNYQPDPNPDLVNRSSSRSTSNSTASTYGPTQTLKSNTLSPGDTPHTLHSQYSDPGPLSSNSLPNLGQYVSPSLRHHSSSHSQGFADHSPLQGLAHSYTAPIERSRSSQGLSIADSSGHDFRYAKRPRANTTAIAPMYTATSLSPNPAVSQHHALQGGLLGNSPNPNAGNATALISPGTTGTPQQFAPPSRSFSESQAVVGQRHQQNNSLPLHGLGADLGGDSGYELLRAANSLVNTE